MNERIYIKWKPGANAAVKAGVRASRGLNRVGGYERLESEIGWEVCELPPGLQKKTVEWLQQHPNVLDVEAEGFVEDILPPQPEAGGSAMSTENFDSWYQTFVGVPAAHTVTRGAGVTVAILDNGLNPGHSWTDPRVGEQKLFRATETNGVLGGSHGQPVTGCSIAIAPDSRYTNYKIGSSSDVRCAWADVSNAGLYAKEKGHKAVNLSYGGGSSILLTDTFAKLREAKIAVIVAAGNSSDATQFPARLPSVYAVAALDESGNIAGFSCRGKIDIAAPGVNLVTSTNSGGWGGFSGTSGATPIVSGIVALVLSKNPTWTGVQAIEHVMATATKKDPPEHYGAGLANAAAALGATEPTPPPEPPPSEPPPPEPPPSPTRIDLTPFASITCTPAAYEAVGEGLAKLTDKSSGTKCLWFDKRAVVTFTFSSSMLVDELMVMSANDYPVRDPGTIRVTADGTEVLNTTGNVWPGRFQEKRFAVTPVAARVLMVEFVASGQWSPGDKGIGICQVGEAALLGTAASTEPEPPPPEPPPPEPPPPPPEPTLRAKVVADIADIEGEIPDMESGERALLKAELDRLSAMVT